jgi:hypothetical protein
MELIYVSEPERKKEPPFKKVENGMIYQTEDGKVVAVGLPTQIEELKAGEGKAIITMLGEKGEAKGAHYVKTNYDWKFVSDKYLTPGEVQTYGKEVADLSGTVPVTLSSSMIVNPPLNKTCPKCQTLNPPTNTYCGNCGTKLCA